MTRTRRPLRLLALESRLVPSADLPFDPDAPVESGEEAGPVDDLIFQTTAQPQELSLPADVPLDPGFGTSGRVDIRPGADVGDFPRIAELIALPDGSTLTLATFRYDWFIERRLPNGETDAGFGTAGRVTLYTSNVPPGQLFIEGPPITYTDMAVTRDGGIVAIGTQGLGIGSFPPPSTLLIVKLFADGRRDTAFETRAAAVTGFGPNLPFSAQAAAVAEAADGGLLIAGTGFEPRAETAMNPPQVPAPGFSRAAVLKLKADGSLDTGFGPGGTVVLDGAVGITPGVDNDLPLQTRGIDLAVDAAGRPLLLGSSTPTGLVLPAAIGVDDGTRPFVARLTADGRLDTTFAGDGIADLRAPAVVDPSTGSGVFPAVYGESFVTAFGLAPANGGVLVGLNDRRLELTVGLVHRLSADGTPDGGFGQAGFARVEDLRGLADLAVRPEGSAVLVTATDLNRSPVALTVPPTTAAAYRVSATGAVENLGELSNPSANGVRTGLAIAADSAGRTTVGLTAKRVGVASTETLIQLARLSDTAAMPPASVLIGGGPGTLVRLTENSTGGLDPAGTVTPFAGYSGPVRGLMVDLNGDDVPDGVYAVGPGGGSRVQVQLSVLPGTRPSLTPVAPLEFSVFEAGFTGGIFLATGDITGDGTPDLIVTPDVGGGPVVAVFDGKQLANRTPTAMTRFFGIDDPNFRGGARTAVGDRDGDGRADLIVAAGEGGGPRVAEFDGRSIGRTPTRLRNDYFAFSGEDVTRLRNGVTVSAGDLDADGRVELAFGSGRGGAPRVRVVSGENVRADFFANGDTTSRAGSTVAVRDGRLLVGVGRQVRVYPDVGQVPGAEPPARELAAETDALGSVYVG